MSWRTRALKYITFFIILMLVLNPETAQIGLFIDAAGLEILLLLFEVQLLAIGMVVYNQIFKSVIAILRSLFPPPWLQTSGGIAESPRGFAFMLTSEATLMHLLVCSAAVGMLFRVIP